MDNQSAWKDKVLVDSFIKGKRSAIPYASAQLDVMLRLLQHNDKQIKKFIDLGSGDGILSHLILEQFEVSKAYLIDFSEPMLEAAAKRLVKYNDRINIFKGDISNNSWQTQIFSSASDTVDAFVSGYCIHHLPDGRKYELYQEIYNRLSPGGIFINIEHVASKSTWGEALSDKAFVDSLYSFEKESSGTKTWQDLKTEFDNRQDKKDNILLSPETQCTWLREIGFTDVDIYFKSFELAVFAGRKI